MTEDMIEKLRALADKYETKEFIVGDPSSFMHRYGDAREKETAAFIAANLAFGRREQILSHVEKILAETGSSPSGWITGGGYKEFFGESGKSFYRTYTNGAMVLFFGTLGKILSEEETPGEFFRKKWESSGKNGHLHEIIASEFPEGCTLVPHTKESAAKKLNMMLRWFVRTDSPVDIGTWKWFDRKNLLMPLDTHVMQESTRLSLIKPARSGKVRAATLATAEELTETLREAFPDDPVRGDFALFGLGVDEEKKR